MPPELDDVIAAHYAQGLEHERLTTWGRLEALRTQALLGRFLPPAPAVIVDVGGGTGAYALPLARQGYEVHLIDPWAPHIDRALEQANEHGTRLASAVVGDARALPCEDGCADAVLLFGPLYHLIAAEDRRLALREAKRTLQPGGLVMAAAISRFASTYEGIRAGFVADPVYEALTERALRDGVHRNLDPDGRPEWFTLAYFHRPEELAGELTSGGFADVQLIAVEGAASFRDLARRLDDDADREAVLRAIERTESEPSLLGASAHIMAIGRAPTATA